MSVSKPKQNVYHQQVRRLQTEIRSTHVCFIVSWFYVAFVYMSFIYSFNEVNEHMFICFIFWTRTQGRFIEDTSWVGCKEWTRTQDTKPETYRVNHANKTNATPKSITSQRANQCHHNHTAWTPPVRLSYFLSFLEEKGCRRLCYLRVVCERRTWYTV